MGDFDHGYIQ